MNSLHKIKYVFKHSTACHFRIFPSSQKWVLLKVVNPLKIYQITKFHGTTLLCIHLKSLNVRHFGMVAWPPHWISKNLPTVSKVNRVDTHRQDGDVISLYFSFTKESRLTIVVSIVTALMLDAVRTSETSTYFHDTTQRYIPQCCRINNLNRSQVRNGSVDFILSLRDTADTVLCHEMLSCKVENKEDGIARISYWLRSSVPKGWDDVCAKITATVEHQPPSTPACRKITYLGVPHSTALNVFFRCPEVDGNINRNALMIRVSTARSGGSVTFTNIIYIWMRYRKTNNTGKQYSD
jgi:hypothetical protein